MGFYQLAASNVSPRNSSRERDFKMAWKGRIPPYMLAASISSRISPLRMALRAREMRVPYDAS